MGRTTTPMYRLETDPIRLPDGRIVASTPVAWERRYGLPTGPNIERWIRDMIASQKPGGSNAHLARAYGVILIPNGARIIRQSTGHVVARWRAPAFMGI